MPKHPYDTRYYQKELSKSHPYNTRFKKHSCRPNSPPAIVSYDHFYEVCTQGSVRKLRALLKAGFSSAACDNQGRCALYLAAENGNLDCCKLLLDHSIRELNLASYKGITPLMSATLSNRLDLVQYLIS